MPNYQARCRNLLEWMDEIMYECRECGMVANDEELTEKCIGPEGVEVCPMCSGPSQMAREGIL